MPHASSAQSLAAGEASTAVVKEGGSLWVWGGNEKGQLGTGTTGGREIVPMRVGEASWKEVSQGASHTVAIDSAGRLWSWGSNDWGQLGWNHFVLSPSPGLVNDDTDWKMLSAGAYHTLALKTDGTLWAWGANGFGQLGNGGTWNQSTPVQIGDETTWATIAAGTDHSLAIRQDGSLYAWGSNQQRQLGINSNDWSKTSPTLVGGQWKDVAAGAWHSLGIRNTGTLWSWGSNLNGQLGLNSGIGPYSSPQQVGETSAWSSLAAGAHHSLGLLENGHLYGWGWNGSGQLGEPAAGGPAVTRIGTASDWVAIASGFSHSVALKSNGVLWTAGSNSEGQLGNNSTNSSQVLSASHFGLADLVLTGLVPTGALQLNQPFPVNAFGQNIGSGDVSSSQSFEIDVRLSSVASWGHTSNVHVGTLTASRDLATGETFNVSGTLTIPARLNSGIYYMGAMVNSGQVIAESDFANNDFWRETPIPFLADLVIDPLTPPAVTVNRGESLPVEIPVRNIGQGDIPAGTAIALQVRLSTNRVWGDSDDLVLAGNYQIEGGIQGGAHQLVTLERDIPEHAAIGSYYLGAWIDFSDEIEEADEFNNRLWSLSDSILIDSPSLEDVLDSGHVWTTGGDSTWFSQSNDFIYGDGAAQSPPLAVGQEAYMQTSIIGPAVITFDWKIDSQAEGNYLAFLVDGVERDRISGNVDWHSQSFLLSAGLNTVRWSYAKTVSADGPDRAWVDLNALEGPGYWVRNVDKPILEVSDIQYSPGAYVLDRDSLTITAIGKNLGANLVLPPGFTMEARLSPNREWEGAESMVLGQMNKVQDLDADNRFVYKSTFVLPDEIPAGDFFIGVFVDSTELVDQFEFEGHSSIGWTPEAGVTIERRPDLDVINVDYDGGYYVIFPGDGKKDELQVSFDIHNRGLADAPGIPFRVQVILSPDRSHDNTANSILLDFEEREGLPRGQIRTYHTTIEIPPGTRLGERLYLIVWADVDDVIAESRLSNNVKKSLDPNIFISEVPVAQAVQNLGTEFEFSGVPWFGQSEVVFEDGYSAQSGKTPHSGISTMETRINLESPSLVAFYWKVSSEFTELKEDFLAFSINGEEKARIRGEVDWHRVAFPLEAGESTLRWSYDKDYEISVGADAGWVDRISYTVPDLIVENFEYVEGPYRSGDDFTIDVVIGNIGEQRVDGAFDLELRFSRNLDWGSSDDLILGRKRVVGLAENGSPGHTKPVQMTVRIPDNITFPGDYYVGVMVDVDDQVVEANEENNVTFSLTPNIELTPNVNLSEALNDAATPMSDLWIDWGWNSDGDSLWYGIEDTDGLVTELFADDGDWVGAWQTHAAAPGKLAHRTASAVEGDHPDRTATFAFQVPVAGDYDVYVWYGADDEPGLPNRPKDAQFLITHSGGTVTVPVNQTVGGDGWVRIARDLRFEADELGSVEARNNIPGEGVGAGTDLSVGGVRLIGVGSSSWDGIHSARSGTVEGRGQSSLEREIEVRPTGPAEIVFRWKASSRPNSNYLRFLISGQEQRRISGDTGWIEERYFIPAGAQVLRWEYVKTNSEVVGEDAGFLDGVEIRAVNKPDLIVKALGYTPGAYVLQRDYLPVEVVVENRGTNLPVTQWSGTDVEVRLSADQIWGSDNDIVLGNFANVTLETTNRLVFSGGLTLPLDTPEGNYYLAVLANPNEKIEEYDHNNNFLWSSGRDIQIRRLPNLVLIDWDYDFEPFDPFDSTIRRSYNPHSVINFNYVMANIGLGSVSGGAPFYQRIELRARDRGQPQPPDFTWPEDAILVATLADFPENLFLPGVSEDLPEGSTRFYQTELILPDELKIMKALDIVGSNATESTISSYDRAELAIRFEFSLIYIVDATNVVEESDEANRYSIPGLGRFHIEAHDFQSMDLWAESRNLGPLPDEGTADFEGRLLEYALDLNPYTAHLKDPKLFTTFGRTVVNHEEYFRFTFNVVNAASDLRYTVEVSSDLDTWTPLLALEPPYLNAHGLNSLTGVGGLTSHPLVVSAAEKGSVTAVSIRDHTPMHEFSDGLNPPGRFFRLHIEKKE